VTEKERAVEGEASAPACTDRRERGGGELKHDGHGGGASSGRRSRRRELHPSFGVRAAEPLLDLAVVEPKVDSDLGGLTHDGGGDSRPTSPDSPRAGPPLLSEPRGRKGRCHRGRVVPLLLCRRPRLTAPLPLAPPRSGHALLRDAPCLHPASPSPCSPLPCHATPPPPPPLCAPASGPAPLGPHPASVPPFPWSRRVRQESRFGSAAPAGRLLRPPPPSAVQKQGRRELCSREGNVVLGAPPLPDLPFS
jgi:hypothetical protein